MNQNLFWMYSLRLIQEIVVLEHKKKKEPLEQPTTDEALPKLHIGVTLSVDEYSTDKENSADKESKENKENSDGDKDKEGKRQVKFNEKKRSPRSALTAHKLNSLTPKQTHSPAWRA